MTTRISFGLKGSLSKLFLASLRDPVSPVNPPYPPASPYLALPPFSLLPCHPSSLFLFNKSELPIPSAHWLISALVQFTPEFNLRFHSLSRVTSLFKCTAVDSPCLLSRGFPSACCCFPPKSRPDTYAFQPRLFNHAASSARTLASVSNSCVQSQSNVTRHRHDPSPVFPRAYFGNRLNLPAFYTGSVITLDTRSMASFFGSQGNGANEGQNDVSTFSGTSDLGDSTCNGGMVRDEWYDMMKEAWRNVVDGFNYTGDKVKETVLHDLTPYAQQLLDSHHYIKNVIIPVSGTLTAATLAWVVIPRILQIIHKYAMRGPVSLLLGTLSIEEVPYDKSIWALLEDPLGYLVTFMAFWRIAMMVAPTTVVSQYIEQTWRAALIVSFIWFLYCWKSNVFYCAMAATSLAGADSEKLLAVDRLSSVGLFVIGAMALTEAFGVAMQFLLTVGGIGEGEVVEMGPTTTSLLNSEMFPVIVPNSLFSIQVIVSKSRAEWHAMVTKIPLNSEDLEKIPPISNDIKNMRSSQPKVFLGKEAPYRFLSRVESSHIELTLGCNLKRMNKDELYSAQQGILLQFFLIIKKHVAKLGSTFYDTNPQ